MRYRFLNEVLIDWGKTPEDNSNIISQESIRKRLSYKVFCDWVDSYIGEDTDYNIEYTRNYLKNIYKQHINKDDYKVEAKAWDRILLFKILELEYTGKNGTQQFLDLLSRMCTFAVKEIYKLNYEGKMKDWSLYQNLPADVNFVMHFIFFNRAPKYFNTYDIPFLFECIEKFIKEEMTPGESSFYNKISRIFLEFMDNWATFKYEGHIKGGDNLFYKLCYYKTTTYPVPSIGVPPDGPSWNEWEMEFKNISYY